MANALINDELSSHRFVFLVSISNFESTQTPSRVLDVIDTQIGHGESEHIWIMLSKGLYLHNCDYNGHVIAKKLLEVCLHYRLRFLREIRRHASAPATPYGRSLRFVDWEQISSDKPSEFLRNLYRVQKFYDTNPTFAKLIDSDILRLKKTINDGTRGFLFEEYAGLSIVGQNSINSLLPYSAECRGTMMVYPGPMLPSMLVALAELQRGKSPDQPLKYFDSTNRELYIIRGPKNTEKYHLKKTVLELPETSKIEDLA